LQKSSIATMTLRPNTDIVWVQMNKLWKQVTLPLTSVVVRVLQNDAWTL
jgi:hypothetical protein